MARLVTIEELRIHGVGGSPGAELLGLDSPEEAVVVGEGRGTVFQARRTDRSVEGYVWGRLTSNAALQPLWVLLLPFTLVNVAGWAHHAPARSGANADPSGSDDVAPTRKARRAPWRITAVRGAVHVAAALLTASYVIWAAIIVVDLLGYRWLGLQGGWPGSSGEPFGPVAGVAVGTVAIIGLGALAVLVSRSSRAAFEPVRPDPEVTPDPGRRLRWSADERLSDATFFAHARSSAALIAWHCAVIAAVAAAVVLRTVSAWGELGLGLGDVFVVIGVLQFGVIVVLVALSWDAGLLPAVAVTLATALTNGVFSGVAMLVSRMFADPEAQWGPELALIESFVLTLFSWLVLAGLWLAYWASRGSAAELPPRTSQPAEELDGVDRVFRRRIARVRGLAAGAHRAPRLLVGLAGLFLISSGVAVALRFDVSGMPWRWLAPPEDGLLTALATVLLPGLVLGALAVVWLSAWRRGLRRGVGIIWDILTFWPRRFHPMAVRPYTERAVPEFRARIARNTRLHRGLLISAHSQGSVIALAAAAALPREDLARCAMLTYGSPLRTLYGQVFPAYFGEEIRDELRQSLDAGGGRWVNLYRRTDAIGGPVFGPLPAGRGQEGLARSQSLDEVLSVGGGPGRLDVEVPDPATGPSLAEIPADPLEPPEIEPLRPAWTGLYGHSAYYREALFKQAVAVLHAELDAGDGPVAPEE